MVNTPNEYTAWRFFSLLSLSITLGLAAVFVTPIGLNYLFPSTRVYTQLYSGSSGSSSSGEVGVRFAILNHTLVTTGSSVESLLVVTARKEPWPSPSNVTIRIGFEPFDGGWAENLVPDVTGGDLLWSGEMHQGQSVMLRTTMKLPSDGRYFIGGAAGSSDQLGQSGDGGATRFYLDVQWGVVARVYTKLEITYSNELEGICLNC